MNIRKIIIIILVVGACLAASVWWLYDTFCYSPVRHEQSYIPQIPLYVDIDINHSDANVCLSHDGKTWDDTVSFRFQRFEAPDLVVVPPDTVYVFSDEPFYDVRNTRNKFHIILKRCNSFLVDSHEDENHKCRVMAQKKAALLSDSSNFHIVFGPILDGFHVMQCDSVIFEYHSGRFIWVW